MARMIVGFMSVRLLSVIRSIFQGETHCTLKYREEGKMLAGEPKGEFSQCLLIWCVLYLAAEGHLTETLPSESYDFSSLQLLILPY
jgi:hypothetical protein